jgi:hypothetical protein
MCTVAAFASIASGVFAPAQEKQPETVAHPITEAAKKKQDARLRKELNSA